MQLTSVFGAIFVWSLACFWAVDCILLFLPLSRYWTNAKVKELDWMHGWWSEAGLNASCTIDCLNLSMVVNSAGHYRAGPTLDNKIWSALPVNTRTLMLLERLFQTIDMLYLPFKHVKLHYQPLRIYWYLVVLMRGVLTWCPANTCTHIYRTVMVNTYRIRQGKGLPDPFGHTY